MTVIRQEDLIESVADALQFISYYHPLDFIRAMEEAYHREQSEAARDAIADPSNLIVVRSASLWRRGCKRAFVRRPGTWKERAVMPAEQNPCWTNYCTRRRGRTRSVDS